MGYWGYARLGSDSYLLYRPFVKWLGGYMALVYRSDGFRYPRAEARGSWQLVPDFQDQLNLLTTSRFPSR